MTLPDEGTVLSYPVKVGDKFYDIIDDINKTFGLHLNKDDFQNTETTQALGSNPTLILLDNENNVIFTLVNVDEKPIDNDYETLEIEIYNPLVGNDSTIINHKEELDLFNDKPLNEVILYDYRNNTFLRTVKQLLGQYGYGNIPVIDSKGFELNGMMIVYRGPGKDCGLHSKIYLNSPHVVHLKIPNKGDWKDIYLKTG